MIPDHIEERAAIIQYDAGYTIEEAEVRAGIMPTDTVLLSIDETTDGAIEFCKEWIKQQGLIAEDVKLQKSETQLRVVARRKVHYGLAGN